MENISSNQFLSLLGNKLDQLHEKKATGELVFFDHQGNKTSVFLLGGRLQFVTKKRHRVRRWQRVLSQYCPDWKFPHQIINEEPWEYDFIYQGVSKKAITLEQAKDIIVEGAKECIFELALFPQVKSKWIPQERYKSTFSYFLSLPPPGIHPFLTEVNGWQQQWNSQSIEKILPSVSPVLLKKGKNIIKNPVQLKYLSGNFTIWDIALKSKKSIDSVVKSLQIWREKGLIEFKTIEDLPLEIEEKKKSSPPPQQEKLKSSPEKSTLIANSTNEESVDIQSNDKGSSSPHHKRGTFLIACIDDSLIMLHSLRKILKPEGFEVLSIDEPMSGFGKLMETKPDLIILDLNMPNANGYSVCKFLRESTIFEETPIIILTAQDTSIDKARAKLVGATDFINKPPEADTLINLINHYLGNAKKKLTPRM